MKQKLLNSMKLRATLLVAILCSLFTGTAWATDFTLSSAADVTQDGITVSFAKGSGGTAPTWYAAGLRLYASNTITISSSSNITGITFNWEKQGNKAFASATANVGTYTHPSAAETGTWSGSATSVTFTIGSSGQLQLNTLSVTVASGGGDPTPTCAAPTFLPVAGAVASGTEVEITTATAGATIYYTMGNNPADPTTSSSVYSTPIEITAATTIKAIAVKADYNNSEVASASYTVITPVPGYNIDFESSLEAYTDWTFENVGTSNTAITAHGGSKYGANINGSGNGTSSLTIQTKQPIAYPNIFTCYVSRVSTNTTASTWTLAVSSNGSTWTEVDTHNAIGMTKGDWDEFSANLSSYSDVYVRLTYGSSTAIRAVDDISITMRDPSSKVTPTVTINASGLTTDLAGGTNVAAGTITATVTSGENTISTPAVTWSSSNTDVATVNETTGAITLIAVGTTTITASFAGNDDYNEASETYELTVTNSMAPGGEANPYKVAQALTAIQALPNNNATTEHYYISGIVSAFFGDATGITTSSSKRYYISDNGTTTTQLLVYNGKGLNNVAFSSDDDLLIGDRVTIYGAIQKYNGDTPEIAAGNYIVSRVTKTDNDIAATGAISLSMANPETTADVNNYISSSSDGALSFESDNTSIVTVDDNGIVTPIAAGTTTITVSQAATATYKAGSTSVTVTVAPATKADNEILLDETSGSTTYGTQLDVAYAVADGYDGTMTYSSNLIADVSFSDDYITFTPKAVGEAVITISAPATAAFNAADDVTFTLTVTAPAGQSAAYVSTPTTVFEETFASCTGTNSDFGTSSTGDGNGTFTADSGNEWVVENAYGANGAAKFGASKKEGSATTPSITTTVGTTYTLTFKAAPWASESTTMTVTITGGTIDDENSVETSSMNTGEWNEFSYDIVASSTSMTIAFTASKNRFFLDEVKVSEPAETSTTVTTTGGYATYCYQYPLNLDGISGAKAYIVEGINTEKEKLTLTQITGTIKGGVPFVLKADDADDTFEIPFAEEESTTVPADNHLVGTLAPTFVAQMNGDYTNFAYSKFYECFVKLGDSGNTVPANRAYLPINLGSGSPVKAFTFEFSDADGIQSINNEQLTIDNSAIFNLAGQRLNKLQKGINIVNCKKVLVK